MITPQQALEIKAGLEASTKHPEIAKEVGVALSTVVRLNSFLKKGKFNEYLEKAEHMAAVSKKGGARAHAGRRPQGKNASDKIILNIRNLHAQGLVGREIAKRLGIGASMVYYWISGPGGKRKIAESPTLSHQSSSAKLRERIVALREKGLTINQIAEKLDIPSGTISYRLYGDKAAKQSKELNNGDSSNGTSGLFTNKHLLLGIAFAETERFIGVLSERLNVPSKILRSGLSELLGHSPVRE